MVEDHTSHLDAVTEAGDPAESLDRNEPDSPDEERAKKRRAIRWLIIVAIVIVIILLLLRSCGSPIGGQGDLDDAYIGEYEGLEVHEESIAVWVRPGADLDDVLSRNDLGDAPVTDLEDGAFVIDIGDADADRIIERLKSDEGLVDAGYVFLEEPR